MSARPPLPAMRPIALGPYHGTVEPRPDGSWLLRSTDPLQPYPRCYTDALARWAHERPDATFLAQRDERGNWRRIGYADALDQVRRIGQALLDRGLSAERPVAILSRNSIEHALLMLGAQHVGIPAAPISPAYSLLDETAAKVRNAIDTLTPGLVFADDAAPYARAIDAAVPASTELVFLRGHLAGRTHTPFERLLAATPTDAVDDAHRAIGPDTPAKFLFTSGSTKQPKAVLNTHGMLCCNQQMHTQCYPFLLDEPPVLVDWLPWHHTAGGNIVLGLALTHGGSLYIDEGKPTEAGMAETLRNLREISPTIYYTVPKGLEALARAMRDDIELRERFFARLRLIFPSGAALPPAVQDAIDALAVETVGARIPMTMGLGMTETSPFAISAHLPDWQAGVIGLPAPGLEVKLAPAGDKLEVRYRGPSVLPCYWRAPVLTHEAFDDEGFFRSGDAARFIDPQRPAAGLRFDGRIAEDFKLISGTWVNVGALRAQIIAAGAPYIQDIVLTGHDRDEIGMLVLLLPTAARLSRAVPPTTDMAQLAHDAGVRAWLHALLARLAEHAHGSSHRITRALILVEPPSMALGEITDKGSINQRAVLAHRGTLVAALYGEPVDARVVTLHAASAATR